MRALSNSSLIVSYCVILEGSGVSVALCLCVLVSGLLRDE